MLTKIKAYSSWPSAPTLLLSNGGRAETDLIQIRNIEGLDPVKAAVNTSLFGSVDGASYIGSSVGARNIVLTVHPNPDWDVWTFESLRRLIYSYFMPKRPTRLVFEQDDMSPVEITGIVEDVSANAFSKDPEFIVSIICPNPYFIAVQSMLLQGQTDVDMPINLDYYGTIETGFKVKISSISSVDIPSRLDIRIGWPTPNTGISVNASVDNNQYFEMSSVAMRKYIQTVEVSDGVITNQLSKVAQGSSWPILQPGENELFIGSDLGTQDFAVEFFELYGGL